MQFLVLTLIPLFTLTTAIPTTKTEATLIQTCTEFDIGKSCRAGFISGIAATGTCTSTIINLESGIFACSVASTTTETSPRPSHSWHSESAATDKGKHLEDLRRMVEEGIPVLRGSN